MTLHTYCHQRMRKMMTTSRRMMVTKQPIRMEVWLSSGGWGFDVTVLVSRTHHSRVSHTELCVKGFETGTVAYQHSSP